MLCYFLFYAVITVEQRQRAKYVDRFYCFPASHITVYHILNDNKLHYQMLLLNEQCRLGEPILLSSMNGTVMNERVS